MKAIIFDSGVLITLSMNSLLEILKDLKKTFSGKFLITREVENESVIRPMQIKKYKLGAMRIKSLINEKIIEFPDSLNISDKEIDSKTKEILNYSNSMLQTKKRPIHLIESGEASCLALSSTLFDKGIDNVIAIDERTTRMIIEKPENLRILMEDKLHTPIELKLENKNQFKNINFIRSTELIYVAYKKNLIKNSSKDMLDAMLYGAKYKGCSISYEEIKQIEKMD